MSSGNGVRPNWLLALAGIQAGVGGALVLLGYLALDSAWYRRSIWLVPNLMASTFYGESAYQPRFGTRTSTGLALLLVLYGLLGALFGLLVRDQGSRLRMTILGLIFGTGWFFLSFDVLWKYVNPMVRMYSPDRAMFVGHLLYGGLLGRRFPAYVRSMSAGEQLAEAQALTEARPTEDGR
jgi:hypothetical protein